MSRRAFGSTWWGRAWVEALEQRARLDPNRLPRGRAYARRGTVADLVVAPGEVRAAVQGSRRTPYAVRVRVRAFDPAEWDRLLDAVAGQLGHTAALLDGELPPGVVEDVRAAGLDLLPGAGEVGPRCSCPDWADPCKHAAAVCYLVADALDADPFALLLLRGRSRDEVLAGLRARRRAGSEAPAEPAAAGDAGVPAREAYARTPADPPAPALPPRSPGRPAALPVDPPADTGLTRDDLVTLAADAARRAWELATGAGDGGLHLTVDADVARLAETALGTPELSRLAGRAGLSARELARRALAWRAGGADGVAAAIEDWPATAEQVAAGRAGLGAGARARANRVTRGEVQLRLGRDGRWYRFVRRFGGWDLAGPGDADPGELVDEPAQPAEEM